MCGIVGIHNYANGAHVSSDVLRGMLDVLQHRGPDDQGWVIDDEAALGAQRLSIVDLKNGHQPMFNEDRSVAVAYNGETYNYRELRRTLLLQGHQLTTDSDTEVIAHLYEEHGLGFVEHLRGMFAIAIWDGAKRQLVLARDRLGIKPIYYYDDGKTLLFASEIKAILQHPKVSPSVDYAALSAFISLQYVPSPMTMFAGIRALPPGHVLTCAAGRGGVTNQYWDLSFVEEAKARDEGDYAEELDELMRECVKMHLIGDVPVGAFLSGGLDSSSIVAIMSRYVNSPVKTYALGFAATNGITGELPYARSVSKHCATEHTEVIVTPGDFLNVVNKVVWHLDQPIADDAVVANYCLARAAARDVKTVLTGEGGDELFGGYARYLGERFAPIVQAMPRNVLRLASIVVRTIPGMNRIKKAYAAINVNDEAMRLVEWFPLFNKHRRQALLTDHARSVMPEHAACDAVGEQLSRSRTSNRLNRMLYVDSKLWLADDLLARGDKMAMAVSLEARVPLLDHKLVEFAARLPTRLKIRGLTRKYLLRKTVAQWLPRETSRRAKKGFPVAYASWFRNELREYVRDTLSPATILSRGLFSANYVSGLLHEHESGFADHSSLIWGLINIELWQRTFIDKQPGHGLAHGARR